MVVYRHTQEVDVDADHSVVAEEDVEADVLKKGRALQGLVTVVTTQPLLRTKRCVQFVLYLETSSLMLIRVDCARVWELTLCCLIFPAQGEH